MAMLTRSPSSPKALQRFQNCIAFIWPSLQHPQQPQPGQSAQQQQVQNQSTNLDAIDCFTNALVNRKTKKWEDLRDSLMMKKKQSTVATATVNDGAAVGEGATTTATTKTTNTTSFTQKVALVSQSVMKDIEALKSPPLGLDIRSLSQAQLDNLLLSTLEIKNKVDFLYLIRQCIRWQQLPSNEVLIACLKYLSTLSRLQQIESFADICRVRENPLSKEYADLAPFKAMALWRSGGADAALSTLHRGYDESTAQCAATAAAAMAAAGAGEGGVAGSAAGGGGGGVGDDGRRMIRNAFRTIAEETLAQKSEAVLVTLMEIARAIYAKHRDVFVIACVWKQCFASDWFCDQKTAADLFAHYKELQQLVARRSNTLCASFLGRHNIDAVHRMIELFLQYEQKEGCGNCLSLLFNYQYNRRDLRACAEIIKSCSELEMPLSEMQNEQFLSLFLNQNGGPAKSPSAHSMSRAAAAGRLHKPIKEFQYKF